MQVKQTVIHKISVERACGCKASRSYENAALNKEAEAPETVLCPEHQALIPGVATNPLAQIMLEFLDAETLRLRSELATESRLRVEADAMRLHSLPSHTPAQAQSIAPAPVPAPHLVGERPPAAAASRPRATAPGSHRPTGSSGQSASGFKRAAPAALSGRAAAAIAQQKTAARPSEATGLDLDEAVEDTRITKLLDISGALDEDEDGFEDGEL